MLKKILCAVIILPSLLLCTGAAVGECLPCEEWKGEIGMVKMTARITEISDKLEVEVIQGSYGAHGTYWVNADDSTPYFDECGRKTGRGELSVGDVIEITYTGQTALSLPPQIFARKIKIIERAK